MHRLVVSQPGKGQPGWGGQAMSRGSPTPPTGRAPGKEELLFAPCFCLPGRLGGNGASIRRLAEVCCHPTLRFLISGMLTLAERCTGQILPRLAQGRR